MVQVVKYNNRTANLNDVGQSLGQAFSMYAQGKKEKEKVQELSVLNQRPAEDATEEERQDIRNRQALALAKHGTIQDMLKHNKQILLEDELYKLDKKRLANQPKVANNDTLVSDQDVGGQANEDSLQVTQQSGPETLAPTQVPTGKNQPSMREPEENLEEKLNDINRIGIINPAIGNQLLKTESILQKKKLGDVNRNLKEEIHKEDVIDRSYDATQKYRDSVIENIKAAENSNNIIDRMEQLSKDPSNMSTPGFVSFMQKFGVPVGVFGTPTDEEMDKLSGELTKKLPASWAGKILASEFATLLRTIPSLVNSPEGRKEIIRNMRILNQPAFLEYEATNELMKEYEESGKKIPRNLREKVFEKMRPAMNELHKEFVYGSERAEKLAGGSEKIQSPEIEKKIKESNLPPPKSGKTRYISQEGKFNGKFFDLSEEEFNEALKQDKSLVKVS